MDAASGAVHRRYGIAMTEIIMLLKFCAIIVIFLMLLAAARVAGQYALDDLAMPGE